MGLLLSSAALVQSERSLLGSDEPLFYACGLGKLKCFLRS
jgi:hypothetical protein